MDCTAGDGDAESLARRFPTTATESAEAYPTNRRKSRHCNSRFSTFSLKTLFYFWRVRQVRRVFLFFA